MIAEDEAITLFHDLLGRPPDPGAVAWLTSLPSRDRAAAAIRESVEWRARHMAGLVAQPSPSGLDTTLLHALVDSHRADPALLDQHVTAVNLEDHEVAYLADHRVRFDELYALLLARHARRPIRSLLDVGWSWFTAGFYTQLLPLERLVTVEMPLAWRGRPAEMAMAAGSTRHVHVDLEHESVSVAHGGTVDELVDVAVCCEVIEHLVVDPADVIADLLATLQPGGTLVLSTPNLLQASAFEALARGESPAAVPPRRGDGNLTRHHHVRESTMTEVIAAVEQAGGTVALAGWSACWDPIEIQARIPVEQWSNLVVVAGRADEADPDWLRRP
jgi:hypothetical protein